MSSPAVHALAWVVTAAGIAVNLCLGILCGWSVWKAALVPADKTLHSRPMEGRTRAGRASRTSTVPSRTRYAG